MAQTPEERRAKAAERSRKYRAEERAQKIANGTYRQPTQAQAKQLATLHTSQGMPAEIPEHIRTSLDKRSLYLAYLEKGLRRTQAAEKADVSYSTVKYWRKSDDAFRAREQDVDETFLDNVEDVVRQLAQANDLKAALTILERRRPEVWAPKQRVEVEHTLQFSGSLEERMSRIARLMEAAKTPELEPVVWEAQVIDDPADPQFAPDGS